MEVMGTMDGTNADAPRGALTPRPAPVPIAPASAGAMERNSTTEEGGK